MSQRDSDDLGDDYAKAGFSGHLAFGRRPALLVVDVVMAYLKADSPLYAPPFELALQSNIRLVNAARSAGVPVIFTNVQYGASGADGGVFFRKVPALKCFVSGSTAGAFSPNLLPAKGEIVVTKQYASAFFGTSLASTLCSMEIDTVMVTGFSTSGCVRASALDAMQHGFIPFVVREACGDRDARPHESNLFDLQAKYAEVVPEIEALRLLASVSINRLERIAEQTSGAAPPGRKNR